MTKSPPVEIQEHPGYAVVTFRSPEASYLGDGLVMADLWEAFEASHLQAKRLIVFRTPRNHFCPRLVDGWLERAKTSAASTVAHGKLVAQTTVAANVSVRRLLDFLKSSRALTIGVVEGEVDFDLLGLFLACSYRVCSDDTTLVNRTLHRGIAPGCATPWFLAKILGHAKVRRLYLNEVSLSAVEAKEFGIVDEIVSSESLTQRAIHLAKHFSEKSPSAMRSLLKSINNVDLTLEEYLEKLDV